MNEEELYSSVARGDAGYEEDSSKIDAANSATFGAAEDSGVDTEDGYPAGSGKSAWGNAGAGVAAVKGSQTRCGSAFYTRIARCEAGILKSPSYVAVPDSSALSPCSLSGHTLPPCNLSCTSCNSLLQLRSGSCVHS